MRKIVSDFLVGAVIVLIVGAFFVPATLGLVAGLAHAESGGTTPQTTVGDPQDKQVAAQTGRTNLTTADVIANIATAVPIVNANGRSNVGVSVHFSAASQTCKIKLAYSYKKVDGTEYIHSLSDEVLVTAPSAATLPNGKFVPPIVLFPACGAFTVRVLLTQDVSGGANVDFWPATF